MEKENRLNKIAIVGPESTGKSWLAQQLAVHYDTIQVPEYARQFIENLSRPYKQSDLVDIAKGQLALEDELSKSANDILICDTNLIVIKIWSEFKYQTLDPWIVSALNKRQYAHHLLCDIDLPWEPDDQREHPDQLQKLFTLYHEHLIKNNIPFTIISGKGDERLKNALIAISNSLNIS